jgi:CelD/BcsL family acetyltransferase involved in cellulose biosynthesis
MQTTSPFSHSDDTHCVSYDVTCVTDLESLREEWLHLEQAGFSTPYQHLNWVTARVKALSQHSDVNYVYGVVRKASGLETNSLEKGHVGLLLPLKIYTKGGICCATLLGGKHANYQMPLYAADVMSTLTPETLQELLKRLAQVLKNKFGVVDVFVFRNQPTTWLQTQNPLALIDSYPSPSDAYGMMLEHDIDATFAKVMSRDTLKKLRKKLKHLEAMGQLRIVHAQNEADVEAFLKAFFLQKAKRFAQVGVANPFDAPEIQTFLHTLFTQGRLASPPTASLNALILNDHIIAVNGGVLSPTHFSGMITSYDMAPEYAKNSPGQVLFMKLIELKAQQGVLYFDFGVGEASYKDIFSSYTVPLRDSVIGMTLKGKIASHFLYILSALKRRVKRSPLLWRLFQKALVLKGRLG